MKFMLHFRGQEFCLGCSRHYNRHWQLWLDELKRRRIFEEGEAFCKPGLKTNKVSQTLSKGLAGYVIINVSTEEEAVEVAKQAPYIALGGPAHSRGAGDVRVLEFQVC